MNEIIQDTRCYTILGLKRLPFVDSSSHIWRDLYPLVLGLDQLLLYQPV